MSVRPFAEQGHYTVVHDAIFDVVMPYAPPNAFKVLMFVLRKTRGWKKERDVLRYAEIKAGTGIRSDTTLAKELEWLTAKKLLLAFAEDGQEHEKGTRRAPAYALNREFELRTNAAATPENGATENGVARTPENGVSNNHPSQEPNDSSNDESANAAKGAAMPMGQYGIGQLMERISAARKRGARLHSPTDKERRSFGEMFKQAAKDGQDTDTMLLALDYMVAKAAGEVEGETKAWCGYRTALDRVLEGWKPGRAGSAREDARERRRGGADHIFKDEGLDPRDESLALVGRAFSQAAGEGGPVAVEEAAAKVRAKLSNWPGLTDEDVERLAAHFAEDPDDV